MPFLTPWFALLPHGLPWVALGTCLLILAGWLVSILIAWRRGGSCFWILFPLTHPLALLNDLIRWRDKAWMAPSFYLLGMILWAWGGYRSHQHEFGHMHRILAQLKYEAQPIRAPDLARVSPDPERNRWDHPYLKPLAEAASGEQDAAKVQESLDQVYGAYQRPQSRTELAEDPADRTKMPTSFYQPFLKYGRLAADLQLSQTEPEQYQSVTLPQDMASSVAQVAPWVERLKKDTPQLAEALQRPENHYPYAWEKGFAMLLPHLSTLRNMATAHALKTIHHAILGEAEAARQSTLLGFELCATQSMDLIISRLVQAAMLQVTLEGMHAALTKHLWDAPTWEAMDQQLQHFEFLDSAANCIRSERAFGQSSIEPIIQGGFSQSNQALAQLTGSDQASKSLSANMWLVDQVISPFSQAFLCKQWRLCLEVYATMIRDLEQSSLRAASGAWVKARVHWDQESYRSKGIFAQLLLPALNQFQDSLFKTQSLIHLTRTCIQLELIYLKQGQYPERLAALNLEDYPGMGLDPMTGKPLPYQSLDQGLGFELYSFGLNGEDDGGFPQEQTAAKASHSGDDLLIRVAAREMQPPRFIPSP